jgi:arsenate reductase
MRSAGIEPQAVPEFVSVWVRELYGESTDLQSTSLDELADQHFDTIITLCGKSHDALPEHPEDRRHVRWDFHHPDDEAALRHLEIELSERIRLFLQANPLI